MDDFPNVYYTIQPHPLLQSGGRGQLFQEKQTDSSRLLPFHAHQAPAGTYDNNIFGKFSNTLYYCHTYTVGGKTDADKVHSKVLPETKTNTATDTGTYNSCHVVIVVVVE